MSLAKIECLPIVLGIQLLDSSQKVMPKLSPLIFSYVLKLSVSTKLQLIKQK